MVPAHANPDRAAMADEKTPPVYWWRPIVEGTVWSLIGLLVVYLLWCAVPYKSVPSGLFRSDFARRWDGGCHGWTFTLACWHSVADILHYWSYVTIAFVILRLHPAPPKVKAARSTVKLMFAFILGCGIVHLLEAFTVIDPLYNLLATIKFLNAIISVLAALFVARALTIAFGHVRRIQQKAYADLERERASIETERAEINLGLAGR